MDYKHYQHARDQVWALLIRQDVRALPVRISAICRDIGVTVKVTDNIDSDGYSAMVGDRPLVVVNGTCTVQRQRFTLAPACVLWGCNAHTPEEIAALCDISLQFAAFRAARMAVLYERGRFLTSPLERQVHEQFADYIAAHRL